MLSFGVVQIFVTDTSFHSMVLVSGCCSSNVVLLLFFGFGLCFAQVIEKKARLLGAYRIPSC
ncbi:hypothetical protein HanPI659440_Chr03g0123681 [Helianthus annuus]|nr:hypothetical protein HanPI659440_Chr03g0123681 [Helianthus annuus]